MQIITDNSFTPTLPAIFQLSEAERVTHMLGYENDLVSDQKYRKKFFDKFKPIQNWLAYDYKNTVERDNVINANIRLRKICQELVITPARFAHSNRKKSLSIYQFNLTCSESDLDNYADFISKSVISDITPMINDGLVLEDVAAFVEENYLNSFGFDFPYISNCDSYAHASYNRITDPDWWARNLRKLQNKTVEQLARDLRVVHRKANAYCSNFTTSKYKRRKADTKKALESLMLVNENDDSIGFDLSDAVNSSVANPDNKVAELMTRIRGTEQLANEIGDVSVFLTLSAPSEYHATLHTGRPNKKYIEGTSPEEAQALFTNAWSKARALLSKSEIIPYGLRVVEPHHDGCPHWHMILFVEPDKKAQMIEILRDKFCEHLPPQTERQKKARFDVKEIDPSKGSAAAYVCKYITKGVGNQEISDKYNLDDSAPFDKINANLSAFTIRQFQFFGLPPVTVWREMRRLGQEEEAQMKLAKMLKCELSELEHFTVESVRRAADSGDWAAFCRAMGGLHVRRKDQTVRLFYSAPQILNKLTNEFEARLTRYGEPASNRVGGFNWETIQCVTRVETWRIETKERFKARQKSMMKDVSGMFNDFEGAGHYVGMADDDYERYQSMLDDYQCQQENALVTYEKYQDLLFAQDDMFFSERSERLDS